MPNDTGEEDCFDACPPPPPPCDTCAPPPSCPPDEPCAPPPPPGGGGCSASAGSAIRGFVTTSRGTVPLNAFLNLQNLATFVGEFPRLDPDDGSFACALAAGSYRVEAGSPDDGRASVDVTLGENETLWVNLTLSFDYRPPYTPPTTFYGGTAWGNVTMGGTGVAGVRVSAFRGFDPNAGPGEPCSPADASRATLSTCGGDAQTNETGSFVVTWLGNGTFDLFLDGGSVGLGTTFLERAIGIEGASNGSVLAIDVGEILLAEPAHLRGIVTDATGAGVPFAAVDAWGMSGGAHEEADETGAFDLALSPGSYGMLVATPRGWSGPPLASARVDCGPFPEADCIELAAGGVAWRNFTLAQGSVISGRVVDADGNGVRANVQGQTFGAPGEPGAFAWAQSESDGSFALTVEPGTWMLRVDPDRFERPDLSNAALEAIDVASGATVALGTIALGEGARIAGLVTTSGGDPVAGASIFANPHRDPLAPPTGMMGPGGFTFTDEDGRFTLAGIEPGAYDLTVEPPFGSSFMRTEIRGVSAASGPWTWQNVTVDEGGTLAGYVTSAEGFPIADAFVDAFWMPEMMGPQLPPPTASPPPGDAPGADARIAPGELSLAGSVSYDGASLAPLVVAVMDPATRAFADGFGDLASGSLRVDALPAGTYRLFAFLDADSDGKPGPLDPLAFFADNLTSPAHFGALDLTANVTGLALVIQDPPEGGWGFPVLPDGGEPGGAPPPPKSPAPGPGPGPTAMPTAGGWGHAITDSNGYFEIHGLANGTFGMFVRPPFGSTFTSASVDALSGGLLEVALGETAWRNFTLGQGGLLTGRVVDGDGEPVAFAWVNAWAPGAGHGGGEPTGPDGTFTIRGLAPGTYEVEAMPPFGSDFTRGFASGVEVAEGATADAGEIVVGSGARLAGVVLDADGSPVANAFVNAFEIMNGPGRPGAFAFGSTDENGAFNLSGLAPGKYGLRVDPPWGTSLSSKMIPDVELGASGLAGYEVRLGAGGLVSGRVLDAAGEPVAGAFVGAWSHRAASGSGTQTDEDGAFTLRGLSPGTDYNLDVVPPWTRQDLALRHFFPVEVREGATTDQGNVTLAQGGALVGRVVDADGAGVAFAFVNVAGDGTFGWGQTDADGAFTIPGLLAEAGDALDVFVQPGPRGGFAPSRAAVAWAANETGVSDAGTIEVGAGKTLQGVVTRDGSGVSADVHVMPALPYSGPPVGGSTTTDADGAWSLGGLPAGAYDVAIRPRDGSAGLFTRAAVTLADADTGWFNATLGEGARVNATVTSGGLPLAGARVEVFSPALASGGASDTDSAGLASITGLPAGAYRVRVLAPGHLPVAQNVTLASGEARAIEVALEAAALASIAGTFSTTNATGPSGWLVVAIPSDGADASGFNVTGDAGGFTLPDLPPGRYHVRVLARDGTQAACKAADLAGGSVSGFAIAAGDEEC